MIIMQCYLCLYLASLRYLLALVLGGSIVLLICWIVWKNFERL